MSCEYRVENRDNKIHSHLHWNKSIKSGDQVSCNNCTYLFSALIYD